MDFKLCLYCMKPFGESGGGVCPNCGKDSGAEYEKDLFLPGGTLGGRYLVGRAARLNGEGAVYAGFDGKRQRTVWVREYFPSPLSWRDPSSGIVYPHEGCEAQYKALKSDFVDTCTEIKRLSVSERVVPIVEVIEENNTVYAVYEDLGLVTLDAWLKKNKGKLQPQEAVDFMTPLFHTVANIHAQGHIHRGISPFSIYVDSDGNLYLWDFCLSAARTASSEIDCELWNGYSAPEQYATNGWQGPWTDVYAAAAVFYTVVSGFVPPRSTLIGEDRPLAPLEDLVVGMPPEISDAVDAAMVLDPENRTQNILSFTAQFSAADYDSTAVFDSGKLRAARETGKGTYNATAGKYMFLALVLTIAFLGGGIYLLASTYAPDLLKPSSSSSHAPVSVETESSEEPESSDPDMSVPSFIGQMADLVQNEESNKARFDFLVREEFSETVPAGTVIDQEPASGTPMPNRGTVILYVSKGTEMVEMINLVGMNYDEAVAKLWADLQLSCERVAKYSPGAKVDSVVATTPSPGEKFKPNDQTIYLFVMYDQDVPDAKSGSSTGIPID